MSTLELARMAELDRCNEIISEGREFQREQGFVQWTDEYPGIETIRNDIQGRKGYVIREAGEIAGYLCIDFAGEPAYETIRGKWETSGPYAVIHRMAFGKGFRGRGLADRAFELAGGLCIANGINVIRADTGFSNRRMQHVLEKNGFQSRGVVFLQNGERLAYEKAL